ncbi:uncharacterized protein RSE6_12968 [Rhynchosporium secalis]|uniref:F-box domain-containing protein n=1 Tax=Rhynchosporium secalis TaxID=38038 RepID=A0A1E1MRT7_RHYSE|nr:uncharacterized protein RSE6_12968 [Rhynchosporium secalis]
MDPAGGSSTELMWTAAQRVLSTPELLEIVLSHLSFHNLLVNASRINHAFNGVIQGSPLIQKRLFFSPSFDQLLPQTCPALRYSSETRFVDRRSCKYDTDATEQVKRIMRDEWPDVSGFKPYNRKTASDTRKEAVRRENASWRKMLLVQPPVKEGHVDCGQGWISSEDWLRMSDLQNQRDNDIVTCRHIAVNKDGIGDFRVQLFPQK